MKAWVWLLVAGVITTIIITVFYVPALHPYVWRNVVDYPLPPALSDPPLSLREHYADRAFYASQQWGGPDHDGPDRCLPKTCYWHTGILHCSQQDSE